MLLNPVRAMFLSFYMIRYYGRSFGVTIGVCALVTYFLFHTLTGDRGVLTFISLNKELERLQNELDVSRAERLKLEHRVGLLRSTSLDLDLLDEQARRYLGYAATGERVYFLDQNRLNKQTKKKKNNSLPSSR
jgi:cell division protein FtsB